MHVLFDLNTLSDQYRVVFGGVEVLEPFELRWVPIDAVQGWCLRLGHILHKQNGKEMQAYYPEAIIATGLSQIIIPDEDLLFFLGLLTPADKELSQWLVDEESGYNYLSCTE